MTTVQTAMMNAGFAVDSDPAEVIRVLQETVGEREAQILDLVDRAKALVDRWKTPQPQLTTYTASIRALAMGRCADELADVLVMLLREHVGHQHA